MNSQRNWQADLDSIYQRWSATIDRSDQKEGWAAFCNGIIILENLLRDYVLDLKHHETESGSQLKNAGPALGRRVLQRYDVTTNVRLGEFGRTSRGGPKAAGRLMALLVPLHLENLPQSERNDLLLDLQKRIIPDLIRLLERRTQLIRIESNTTFEKTLTDLLAALPKISSGAVVQHLVGAKLTLRFPDRIISNDVTSAADAPTGRPGDFVIEDTAIHVTLSPQDPVFEKCIENLNTGLYVYLLVPENRIPLAKKRATEFHLEGQITIKSIEAFIAQNMDEIAEFSKEKFAEQKKKLIQIYNTRIHQENERYAPYLSLSEEGIEIETLLDANKDVQDSSC